MNITVNGQNITPENPSTLDNLIQSLIQDCSRVIAEHNGSIIRKDAWNSVNIQDGDTIELVSFVGGG